VWIMSAEIPFRASWNRHIFKLEAKASIRWCNGTPVDRFGCHNRGSRLYGTWTKMMGFR
jgi:hypothetical protein